MRNETRAAWHAAQAFWARLRSNETEKSPRTAPGIGLALSGGFVRGMAHIGVLRVLEREGIPVSWIAGVSAGSIVGAIYAAGADAKELTGVARSMKFRDVAGWRPGRLGLADSERMEAFLRRVLKVHRFENMKTPLAVVATDLRSGDPVVFHTEGEVFTAVRASCAYPGLFHPVRYGERYLVDGAMSMEVPARALRELGVANVVSVALAHAPVSAEPSSMFSVVNRCFQIMQRRTEQHWREHSDVVIAPEVSAVTWDDFTSVEKLIAAGEKAAESALPRLTAPVEAAPYSSPLICCAR
jgi:NTE family protein